MRWEKWVPWCSNHPFGWKCCARGFFLGNKNRLLLVRSVVLQGAEAPKQHQQSPFATTKGLESVENYLVLGMGLEHYRTQKYLSNGGSNSLLKQGGSITQQWCIQASLAETELNPSLSVSRVYCLFIRFHMLHLVKWLSPLYSQLFCWCIPSNRSHSGEYLLSAYSQPGIVACISWFSPYNTTIYLKV